MPDQSARWAKKQPFLKILEGLFHVGEPRGSSEPSSEGRFFAACFADGVRAYCVHAHNISTLPERRQQICANLRTVGL